MSASPSPASTPTPIGQTTTATVVPRPAVTVTVTVSPHPAPTVTVTRTTVRVATRTLTVPAHPKIPAAVPPSLVASTAKPTTLAIPALTPTPRVALPVLTPQNTLVRATAQHQPAPLPVIGLTVGVLAAAIALTVALSTLRRRTH